MTDAVVNFVRPGLPEPLVPDDADMRDLPAMLVDVQRLRRSKAWVIARRRPELGFYMQNLWFWAWHEVPASSIEDDDDVLADAAMCDPALWPEVRELVLRGWIKCSNGRLYHPVVAEKVLDRLADVSKKSAAGLKGAAARYGRQPTLPLAAPDDRAAVAWQPHATAMPSHAKLEGEVEVEGKLPSPSGFSDEKPTGEGCAPAREGPPPREFSVPQEWIEDARRRRLALGLPAANLPVEAEKFAARQRGGRLARGDPRAAWDEWVLKEHVALLSPGAAGLAAGGTPLPDSGGGMPETGDRRRAVFWEGFPSPDLLKRESVWMLRLTDYRPRKFWHPNWGPRPEADRCEAPPVMIAWTLEKSRAPPGGAVAAAGAEA